MEIIAIVISLASFIVAVWSVKDSKDTARKQLEYAEKTEKRREEKREREKRLEQLDCREAERRVHESPFPIHGTLKDCIEQEYRRIRSERVLRGRG
jgi:hypothetical protein